PCAQVAESTGFVVISDLLSDPAYSDCPLARDGIRFYAGAPLTTRNGFGLGALCVLGHEPRTVSEAEMAALTDLADMVMSQIELQHAIGRVDPV
ncbi:GAF domain-containing protein, partial [Klebsiella pneumoniae]